MKLTAAARKKLPASVFGEPSKRAFPMPDKSHAANAKARATQAVKAGRMGKSTKSKIDAKADKVLKRKNPKGPKPKPQVKKFAGMDFPITRKPQY